MHVEHAASEASVAAFDDAVLNRTAELDEVQDDAFAPDPLRQCEGEWLWAVVPREQAPQMDEEVVYIARGILSCADLAVRVEQLLKQPVNRVLWSVASHQREADPHSEHDIRKYRRAFARYSGIARGKAHTFNLDEGIVLTDVPTWPIEPAEDP